jgi:hypothetical protein
MRTMLPTTSFFMALPSLKAFCSHDRGMLPFCLSEIREPNYRISLSNIHRQRWQILTKS